MLKSWADVGLGLIEIVQEVRLETQEFHVLDEGKGRLVGQRQVSGWLETLEELLGHRRLVFGLDCQPNSQVNVEILEVHAVWRREVFDAVKQWLLFTFEFDVEAF